VNKKELKLAGVCLYLCEGTKLRRDPRYKNTFIYAIEFTNTNPAVISIFSRFLRDILQVPPLKLRGQVFSYPDLIAENLVNFWSGISGIPVEQFQKVIILKAKVSKFKPSQYGTFKIRCSSKEKFLELQSYIDEILKRHKGGFA
jgi:hypothetical protein